MKGECEMVQFAIDHRCLRRTSPNGNFSKPHHKVNRIKPIVLGMRVVTDGRNNRQLEDSRQ
jgi:hypothetical protein